MKKDSFELEGNRYVTTKVMSGFWDVTQKTVADYCRDGMVIGAFKDSSNRYIIPANAKKPLNKNVIERVLWLIITLKNKPSYPIDYSSLEVNPTDMTWVFRYLCALSLIHPIAETCPTDQLPYAAKLTDKGLALIQKSSTSFHDQKGANTATLVQLLPALAKITGYAVELYKQIS